MFQFQAATYESLSCLGPVLSALYVGFAVYWLGELVITPAGERYIRERSR